MAIPITSLPHVDTTGRTAIDHHTNVNDHAQTHTLVSHTSRDHSNLENIGSDDHHAADPHVVVALAADHSISSQTTPQDVTGFAITIAANEVWVVLISGGLSLLPSEGGMSVNWSLPAGGVWNGRGWTVEDDVLRADEHSAHAQMTASGIIAGQNIVLTHTQFHQTYTIRNAGNAGTAQYQMAQAGSRAVASVLRADTMFVAHRI